LETRERDNEKESKKIKIRNIVIVSTRGLVFKITR